MPGQGCGGLWRVPKGSSGFRDVSVQMRAEGSGKFRCSCPVQVPEGSGRFREVPVHVAGQSSGGFWKVPRGVREFRVQMPTATSRMSYMSVASCHRRGDFLGTAPRLPAPESACIGHVGHVFGPCWLQLG